MATQNASDILKLWLTEHLFDGLCDGDDCGCLLDDFAPCGDGPYPSCQPARKVELPRPNPWNEDYALTPNVVDFIRDNLYLWDRAK